MNRDDLRLVFATGISAGNIAGMTALLEQLFNHPLRNPETPGDFLAGVFVLIMGSQNALSQIQGDGLFHDDSLPNSSKTIITLFKML
jgi:hypothetical protein